jgi:uroporphyrinogen-III decarboxylase
MYRDFLLPYHRELTQRLGCPTVLHICGNTLSRIPYIRESGFDAFHFDAKVDAVKAVEATAGRISLIGGVSNIQALYHGTLSWSRAGHTQCAGCASSGRSAVR